jgi:hypothetical protein
MLKVPRYLPLWPAVALGMLCLRCYKDDDQLRPDVLGCESAASRLEECCPTVSAANISCGYAYSSGCGQSDETLPGLSSDEVACIEQLSCAELQSRGVCTRARAIAPRSSREPYSYYASSSGYTSSGFAASGGFATPRSVCP